MSARQRDVLIIGGGVVGLMSAYALVKRGASVTLYEAGDWARESSWAGGGIVAPVPPWRYGQWVDDTVRRSRTLFEAWLPEIERLSGIDCEYRTTGLLLSGDPSRVDFIKDSMAWRDLQLECAELGCREDFEPRLPNPDWPALWLPEVPQVRNPRLTQALVGALKVLGAELVAHAPIKRLAQRSEGVIEAWSGQTMRWAGQHVVLAAGAWTDHVLEASGLSPIGVYPVRGQMLLYRLPPHQAPKSIINTGEGYLIPRADGRILAGSTAEEVGFDRRPTLEAHRNISRMAARTWPKLASQGPILQWSGLRPGCSSERPVVGVLDKKWPGLWVNAGHYRNGLGLAPACAELTAEALA